MDLGSRHANLRAAAASAAAKLEEVLEKTRVPGGKITMSPAAEDLVAMAHAALEYALEADEKAAD